MCFRPEHQVRSPRATRLIGLSSLFGLLLAVLGAAPVAAQDLSDPADAPVAEAPSADTPAAAPAVEAPSTPARLPLAADLPTPQQVDQQLRIVRQDPDLPGKRMEKTLRFKEKDKPKPKAKKKDEPSGGTSWFRGFASWLNDASRIAVWALGAVLLAYVLMRLRTWMRERADAALPPSAALPSHVRDLDIRPESLPDRVGPAAWALWTQGQHRAALSLLYRGALSRLVHDHAVPIRASSTEGDCLQLARGHLEAARMAYVERLVRAWQQAVYGGRDPADDDVRALCDGFDSQLAPLRAPATTATEARP